MQKTQDTTGSFRTERAFLTGCDKNTEWQLPWFIENYKKHNTTDLVIADFGMTPEMLEYAKINCTVVMYMNKSITSGWMLKPFAMLHCPSKYTCWIDTDCHVRGDISGIFGHVQPNKLSMVQDHPWTKRKEKTWHNSGVVAFVDKPIIVKEWARHCVGLTFRGDQEALQWMMGDQPLRRMQFIDDLPRKYNVLRLDIVDNNLPNEILVMHWTGEVGNQEIRKMIESENE